MFQVHLGKQNVTIRLKLLQNKYESNSILQVELVDGHWMVLRKDQS